MKMYGGEERWARHLSLTVRAGYQGPYVHSCLDIGKDHLLVCWHHLLLQLVGNNFRPAFLTNAVMQTLPHLGAAMTSRDDLKVLTIA